MKKLVLTTAATLLTVAAFGQGVVNFSNASSTPGWVDPAFDRYVHWAPTAATFNSALTAGGLVSSNYAGVDLRSLRATLYFAPTSNNNSNSLAGYVQAAGGSTTFKVSTSTTAGSWFGGNRTLDTIAPGVAANLVVIVWDSTLSPDPLSAAAQGGLYGRSAVFQYTPPSDPQAQPSAFLITGLGSFTVGIVPEPSTFALAGLGAAALLIFRRRK
jgi:hypothetical protein